MKKSHIHYAVLGGTVAAALLFGIHGHMLYYERMGLPYDFNDALYGAIQLFPLNSGGVEPGMAPWSLHIARLLAPLATVYAVLMAAVLMGKTRLALCGLRNHAVICGFGRSARALARHYQSQGLRVAVINPAAREHGEESTVGVLRIHGDAADPRVLGNARLEHAAVTAIACGDDAANLVVAASLAAYIRKKGRTLPLLCHIQSEALYNGAMNALLTVFNQQNPLLDVQAFDPDMAVAYQILSEFPLDRATVTADSPLRIQIIIVGLTHFGEVLALTAAHMAHYANGLRSRIVLFDNPVGAEQGFRARYPQAERAAEFVFIPHAMESPEGLRALQNAAECPDSLTTIAFCADDASVALNQALTLPPELRGAEPCKLVRISDTDSGSLAIFLKDNAASLHIRAFGAHSGDLGVTMETDRLARALHDMYLESGPEEGPAVRPWRELALGYRQSNRLQALHLPVKVRALGCRLIPAGKEQVPDLPLSPENVETLARMEHNRWVAERSLAGWRPGPRDDAGRRHPNLVPYEKLDEGTKEYNRIFVRALPEQAQRIGMALRREQAACDS